MNCWLTLGIEEYSDTKAIKMAYAKLLKITKPDDDPQGFKELHAAYKEALELVSEYKESAAPQWFTPPEKSKTSISFDDDSFQEIISQDDKQAEGKLSNENNENNELEQPYSTPPDVEINSVEAHDDQIAVDSNQILEELEAVYGTPKPEIKDVQYANNDKQDYDEVEDFYGAEAQAKLEKDWQYLETQTKLIINTKAAKSTVSDWQFLEAIPSMVDLEFRSQASDLVFEIVSEINQISLEKKVLLVKTPILNYLNTLFHWESKWKHYEELYDEQVNAVFPYLTEEVSSQNKEINKQSKDLHYYRRGVAYFIDMSLVYVFYIVQKYILAMPDKHNFTIIIGIAALYGLIIIPLLESSSIQASFGKQALGLKVVNEAGLRMPWYQSFWRTIITSACVGFWKIAVWINLLLSYKKGVLLQDLMSKSYVVKVRK